MDIQDLYPSGLAGNDPILRWELHALASTDFLGDGEILCDVESVWKRLGWGHGRIGVLILTDLRLAYSFTSFIVRRNRLDEWPLHCVASVVPIESSNWKHKGAIRVSFTEDAALADVQFEKIQGGRERAEEMARTILRQRDLLPQK